MEKLVGHIGDGVTRDRDIQVWTIITLAWGIDLPEDQHFTCKLNEMSLQCNAVSRLFVRLPLFMTPDSGLAPEVLESHLPWSIHPP